MPAHLTHWTRFVKTAAGALEASVGFRLPDSLWAHVAWMAEARLSV